MSGNDALSSAFGFAAYGAILLLAVGELYWLWMAIQLGSFGMFVVALLPPLIIVTAPVGAWALLFGPPGWVLGMFG